MSAGSTIGDPDARPPTATPSSPVRVAFIGGCGRSGSTLLDLMLGEFPAFFSVGELRFIWQRGLVENQLCGCGTRFRACPFWSAVGREAFGGWNQVDAHEMAELERSVDRHRYMPFLIAPGLWPEYRNRLARYTDVLARLYRSIERVTGGTCIIDSTKDAPFAFLLRRVPGIELRVVHLVRDSRGVAFSWTKRVRKPGHVETDAYMETYHPVEMGLRWIVYNLLFHVLAHLGVPRLSMRYERLVTSPRAEIERIARHLEEDVREEEFSFLNGGDVELGVHHTVSGNPRRFERGSIALHLDEEWRTSLNPVHKRLVSIFTFPLLLCYGYVRPTRTRE
jgi:Sulfotransferase family